MEDILIAVAVGVIVPLVLLVGPYLPYLLPVRSTRRTFEDGVKFQAEIMDTLKKWSE